MTDFPIDSRPAAPAPLSPTRPMYWSVRREVWENRSIYIAPLIVTGIVLFAVWAMTFQLPGKMRNLPADPAKRHLAIVKPYSMAPAPIMFTTFVVAFFYCAEALYGERRDRSILFWKSLPVSDRTAVLSKASIPFLVLPGIALVLGIASQVLLLLWGGFVLTINGFSPFALWSEFRYPQEPLVMLYGLTAHVLWWAPLYGWLILISAWARRAPMLWAVLPPVMLMMFEAMMGGKFIRSLIGHRFSGAMTLAFTKEGQHAGVIDQLAQLTPVRFVTTPGLWFGLMFAALFLTAAVRLRRRREPI